MNNDIAKARAKEIKGTQDYIFQQLKKEGFTATREDVRHWVTVENSMVCLDKKEPTIEDVDNLISSVQKLQKAQQAIDPKQVKVTFKTNDDKPICIAWWGDWHLGGSGVDYDKFHEHQQIIEDTEGLHWIGAGDYRDNYLPRMPFGNNEQTIPAGTQDLMVKHELKKVAHNCIGLVRGCHEDFSKQNSDTDLIQSMCEITKEYGQGAVNLWHGGDIHIEHGGFNYHYKCRHKYKFESSLNTMNSMRRIMEIQGPCDVACVAHLHNPEINERMLMGAFRVMMRGGSYKVWDEHGQKLAGYKGISGVPCTIIYPNKKRMIPMFLDEAVRFLKAERS
jgi:hypothetical protein